MANTRLSMRKIQEILRLSFEARFGIRAIAQSCKYRPPPWAIICAAPAPPV